MLFNPVNRFLINIHDKKTPVIAFWNHLPKEEFVPALKAVMSHIPADYTNAYVVGAGKIYKRGYWQIKLSELVTPANSTSM